MQASQYYIRYTLKFTLNGVSSRQRRFHQPPPEKVLSFILIKRVKMFSYASMATLHKWKRDTSHRPIQSHLPVNPAPHISGMQLQEHSVSPNPTSLGNVREML